MRFKLSKSKDKTRINADAEGDNLVLQMPGQQKQDNNRTKGMEQAGAPLKEDSGDEHRPNVPIQELEYDPANDEDVESDETMPLSAELAEESGEEIKMVEIGTTELSGAKPKGDKPETEPTHPETATISGSNSLNDFFTDDEDEINPLASLIAAVPNVTVKELMDDIQEINEILKDWEHK